MARKTNLTLLLSPEERQTLESWQRSTTRVMKKAQAGFLS
jgi:hypothetical protein